MIFHMPKKEIQIVTFKIGNTNIDKVEEFNFLGLTIYTHLKCKKHTDKMSNKCSKISGIKYVFPHEIKCILQYMTH